jgi:hypothetical protein
VKTNRVQSDRGVAVWRNRDLAVCEDKPREVSDFQNVQRLPTSSFVEKLQIDTAIRDRGVTVLWEKPLASAVWRQTVKWWFYNKDCRLAVLWRNCRLTPPSEDRAVQQSCEPLAQEWMTQTLYDYWLNEVWWFQFFHRIEKGHSESSRNFFWRLYDDVEAGNYGFPCNDESMHNISSEKGSRSFYCRAPSMGGTCEEYKRRSNGQLDTLAVSRPEAFTCGITYPAVGDKS